MITYISFDPGGAELATCGVATWNEKGEEIGRTKLNPGELDKFLEGLEPVAPDIREFIIEAYIGYGTNHGLHHIGSRFKTSQQIGMLKYYARRHNIIVIENASTDKNIAMKWSGTKKTWKGTHMPDDVSAYLHGYHRMFKLGLIRPAVLDDKELL
jgi:hypothetical protein